MIPLGLNGQQTCEGLTRREWLRLGGLGGMSLLLPELLAAQAEGSRSLVRDSSFGRAKSCILLFLFGAPAHQDLWDLKPDAPRQVRGEFNPIDTTVPGVRVGEHLPRTARQAHRLAIVRSVSHPDDTHTIAMHAMLTGVRTRPSTNPQNAPDDFPTFGAVLRYLRRDPAKLPAGISLNAPANQVSANNHIFPGFFAGWLGSAFDPMFIPQDPSRPDFRPLPTVEDNVARRLLDSRQLLVELDHTRQAVEKVSAVRSFDTFHDLAFRLVTSPEARRALDLSRESPRLRDGYGPSPFGQGCLLARRLVEAGVSLVTVNWARDDAFWDTHANNFKLLKDSLLPPFDRALAALLDDLEERGLLDETLVVVLGEFGRTPKINGSAGRDHWAACNSVVLAGGGIRGGQIHGASDKIAAYPTTPPISPADLAATIYHALGVDPHNELRDQLDKPVTLCAGRPLTGLFS